MENLSSIMHTGGFKMSSLGNKVKLTWQRGLSVIYQVIGNNVKALEHLEALANNGQAGEREWWALGELYVRLKLWDKAVYALLNAVRSSNGCPKYIFWLGKAEEEAGHGNAAEALYEQAIKKDSEFWDAYAAKAHLILNRGDYEQALGYFSECLKHKPQDAYLLNNLGLCQLGLNRLTEAREYLAEATRRKAGDDHILYNYGTVLVKLDDYEQALAQFLKIKKKDNPAVFNALGYCYGMLQNTAESIRCYQEALQQEPDNQEAQKNLAAIYAKDHDYEQALLLIKNLLQLTPQDPDLLNNAAWIYEALCQYGLAEENYYRSLAASAGNPDIAYNLICCLKKQKKYLEALDIAGYLERIPEKQRTYWSALAQIYEDLGASKLAVDCYNKSLGLE